MALSFPLWQQRGGGLVDYIFTLVNSVMVRIVSHVVCKWLDRRNRHGN